MLTGVLDTGEMKWPVLPGLRMAGQYSDGRLLMEFSPATVILDCGEAHERLPYTVQNTADRFLVHIENTSGAFTLAVEPDNTLRGSGSATVNGRLVSGMQGENVTFRPHSETCEVGTFRPKTGSPTTMKVAGGGTPSAPTASGNVAPAAYAAPAQSGATVSPAAALAPSASPSAVNRAAVAPAPASVSSAGAAGTRAAMRVLITSAFDGGTNPMAGEVVWVMRERMDAVLRSLGAPLSANATPAQAWVAFAVACKGKDCSPVLAQLKTHIVTATKLDGAGKATISTQAATTGTYYFFAQVRTANGVLVWDVPTNFAAGDNAITFTDKNAELIH